MADPIGLARSATTGDLYAAEFDGSLRIMHATTGGQLNTFAKGVGKPYGLAFGPDSRLYVADFTGGQLDAISSAGVVTPFATGLSSPRFVTLGPDLPEPSSLALLLAVAAPLLTGRRRRS